MLGAIRPVCGYSWRMGLRLRPLVPEKEKQIVHSVILRWVHDAKGDRLYIHCIKLWIIVLLLELTPHIFAFDRRGALKTFSARPT